MQQLGSRLGIASLVGLFACVTSLAACGGGSSTGDGGGLLGKKDGAVSSTQTSGVLGTKTLGTMTATDRQMFCDWVASLYGGYGQEVTCDDGSGMTLTITGPTSQAECLAEAAQVPATCAATVSQVEICTRAISTCDPSDDAAATSACNAMMTCVANITTP
jgi:hypothetical protein